jgi:hypothetical protein
MRTTVSLMTIVFLAGCHGGPAHHGGGHTAAPQPVPLTEAAIAGADRARQDGGLARGARGSCSVRATPSTTPRAAATA